MPSARDEAIEAMIDGSLGDDYDFREECGSMIDAVPGSVLVRLAIERGALIQVAVMRDGWVDMLNRPRLDPDAPIYCLADDVPEQSPPGPVVVEDCTFESKDDDGGG